MRLQRCIFILPNKAFVFLWSIAGFLSFFFHYFFKVLNFRLLVYFSEHTINLFKFVALLFYTLFTLPLLSKYCKMKPVNSQFFSCVFYSPILCLHLTSFTTTLQPIFLHLQTLTNWSLMCLGTFIFLSIYWHFNSLRDPEFLCGRKPHLWRSFVPLFSIVSFFFALFPNTSNPHHKSSWIQRPSFYALLSPSVFFILLYFWLPPGFCHSNLVSFLSTIHPSFCHSFCHLMGYHWKFVFVPAIQIHWFISFLLLSTNLLNATTTWKQKGDCEMCPNARVSSGKWQKLSVLQFNFNHPLRYSDGIIVDRDPLCAEYINLKDALHTLQFWQWYIPVDMRVTP